MDTLKAIRSFVAVADTSGFAAAARSLRMSPAAITRDVAALEQQLGCKLLKRTTRQGALTEEGSRYLVGARRILADVAEAESSVMGLYGELRGPVVVSAPSMFGQLHVGPAVIDFALRHPGVSFTTLFLDRMVDLIDEGVDVAVRIAHLQDSSATAIQVGFVRRVICAAPAYLAERGEPKTPLDLARMEGIDFTGGRLPWSFRDRDRSMLASPSVRVSVNSVQMAIEAAAAGLGLVRLLSYQAVEAAATGRLVLILEPFEPEPVPVHIVHLNGRTGPFRVRTFIDYLTENLRRGLGAHGAGPRPP